MQVCVARTVSLPQLTYALLEASARTIRKSQSNMSTSAHDNTNDDSISVVAPSESGWSELTPSVITTDTMNGKISDAGGGDELTISFRSPARKCPGGRRQLEELSQDTQSCAKLVQI